LDKQIGIVLSTGIVGVIVFLVGQLVLKCIIESVHGLMAVIARLGSLLLLYQAKLTWVSGEDVMAEGMKWFSADVITDSYHSLWLPISRLLLSCLPGKTTASRTRIKWKAVRMASAATCSSSLATTEGSKSCG
jgi:hypothetical protein